MDKYKAALTQNYLFKSLDAKTLDELLCACKIKELTRNTPLISQSQEADYFFFILEGQVKLHLISEDGKEKLIKFVNKGETFAEALMFLQKKAYPVNATSTKKSKVLLIPSSYYYQLLSKNAELCMKMLGGVCLKMRGHINEIEMLTILDASQRVMKFFYDLMPYSLTNGESFPINFSKKSIAEKLSMRPETFSRILKRYEDEGIFVFTQHQIQVFNRDKMSEYQSAICA